MIKEFVNAWDKNKNKLEEYFNTHAQKEFDSYKNILILTVELVINPYLEEKDGEIQPLDIYNTMVVGDGNYQGTLLYIIPGYEYEHYIENYIFTYIYYGSCSNCDTLLGILSSDRDKFPNKEQTKDFMSLALHILQHMDFLIHRK